MELKAMIFDDRSERRETLEVSRYRLRPLTREEVRALDDYAVAELNMPTMVLMENAGRGAARVLSWAMFETGLISSESEPASVVVICGPGNNGGDGAVLARHLEASGVAKVRANLKAMPPPSTEFSRRQGLSNHEFLSRSSWSRS